MNRDKKNQGEAEAGNCEELKKTGIEPAREGCQCSEPVELTEEDAEKVSGGKKPISPPPKPPITIPIAAPFFGIPSKSV